MIPIYLSPFANHLWQSTLFAAVAVLLTLPLRKNRAQARYWLWLAASFKFLIPFSLLVTLGSQSGWRSTPAAPPPLSVAIEQISQPFAPAPLPSAATAAVPAAFPIAPALLVAVWLCGCGIALLVWRARWQRIRAAMRAASPLPIETPIQVMSSPTLLEPGVFGVLRPVLLLPEGIADRLTPAQLEAILAHELCHVRRRDNLAAAVHMVVETIFWFHPLVWWIGARLVEERERACDEEVLRLGSEPHVYAEGILNVCKFYLESPLACAAGVTGSALKKRIEAIMTNRISHRLTFARKLLLATAGLAAVAGPIVIGIVNAPLSRAQSQASDAALTFEVASIKPTNPDARNMSFRMVPGGGLNMTNVTLQHLITFAYDVRDFQVSGGPGWIASERYDILAKPEHSDSPTDFRQMNDDQRKTLQGQTRQRARALLAERFQLAIHRESKEFPVYALVVAKNGPKLPESKEGDGGLQHMQAGRGQINAQRSTMEMFTNILANLVGRTVVDRTGLKGTFDFKMEWTPDPGQRGPGPALPGERPEPANPADLSGPSIFTAIQEQLGLELESQRGPVEIIVVDRAEKPSAN